LSAIRRAARGDCRAAAPIERLGKLPDALFVVGERDDAKRDAFLGQYVLPTIRLKLQPVVGVVFRFVPIDAGRFSFARSAWNAEQPDQPIAFFVFLDRQIERFGDVAERPRQRHCGAGRCGVFEARDDRPALAFSEQLEG